MIPLFNLLVTLDQTSVLRESFLIPLASVRRGKNKRLVCVDIFEKGVVDVHLDFVEWNNWLDRSTRASFLEFEDTQYFQLFQICMDIRNVLVDESCSLTPLQLPLQPHCW